MLAVAQFDELAFMDFPKTHRTKIASTNPLERLTAKIKRRTNVVGIFPNDASIVRIVAALLLEHNDEWQLQRRYMQPPSNDKAFKARTGGTSRASPTGPKCSTPSSMARKPYSRIESATAACPSS